jgi:SAM-dependent methyltransferase
MITETLPRPASESLKQAVRSLFNKRGRLYAEVPHPDFAEWPSTHKPKERQRLIEPHLQHRGGTALEIGAYLGAFSHWLEDLGYRVTAVERNPRYVAVMREVRDLWGKKFEIFEGLFPELPNARYDLVLALSVFHHSLKRDDSFADFISFLRRLDCRMMIFEPHAPQEPQMEGAPHYMEPDKFVAFIGEHARLPRIELIGYSRRRPIFKLWRD